MRPYKPGQVAKFHALLPDENPDKLYVVLETKEEVERSTADIKAFNIELSLPPINTILIDDIEVVEVDISDLEGHEVTINKADYSQATGKVIKISRKKIMLDLTKGVKGVETNVWLTIQDENGTEHTGTLFLN
jgi:hypothetical protein